MELQLQEEHQLISGRPSPREPSSQNYLSPRDSRLSKPPTPSTNTEPKEISLSYQGHNHFKKPLSSSGLPILNQSHSLLEAANRSRLSSRASSRMMMKMNSFVQNQQKIQELEKSIIEGDEGNIGDRGGSGNLKETQRVLGGLNQVGKLIKGCVLARKEDKRKKLKELKKVLRKTMGSRIFQPSATLDLGGAGARLQKACMALSSDGESFIVRTPDRGLGVYTKKLDKSGYELRQKLSKNRTKIIRSVVLSGDSKSVICGFRSGSITIWTREEVLGADGKPSNKFYMAQELEGHQKAVNSLSLDRDNRVLISGSADSRAVVWARDRRTNELKKAQILVDHSAPIFFVSLSFCGETLITASLNKVIKIYRRREGQDGGFCLWQTLKTRFFASSLAMSSDGSTMVSGAKDALIRVWVVRETSKRFIFTQKIEKHADSVNSVCVSKNGNLMISGSLDLTVRTWYKNRGVGELYIPLQALKGHENSIVNLVLSRDETTLISASMDKRLIVWSKKMPEITQKPLIETIFQSEINLKTPQKSVKLGNNETANRSRKLITGSNTLVTGSEDKIISIWRKNQETQEYSLYQKLDRHTGPIASIAISTDTNMIVSGSEDLTVRLWKKKNNSTFFSLFQILRGHKAPIRSVNLSGDVKMMVSGSDDLTIKIWKKGQNPQNSDFYAIFQTLDRHNAEISSVLISLDGLKIVSSSLDSTTKVWQKSTKKGNFQVSQTLKGHQRGILCSSMSIKGLRMLITGSEDCTAIIWKKTLFGSNLNFEHFQTLYGHKSSVTAVRVSTYRQETTIATASLDKTVKIWKKSKIHFSLSHTFQFDFPVEELVLEPSRMITTHSGSILGVSRAPKIQNFFSDFQTNYSASYTLFRAMSKHSVKELLEYLLTHLPNTQEGSKNAQIDAKKIQNLHSKINPIFWFCLFQSSELLSKALSSFDYHAWVYSNGSKAFDPFLYSLELDDPNMMDVWVDYFSERPDKLRIGSPELLSSILGSTNPRMQFLGLANFLVDSVFSKDVDPIKVYPFASSDYEFESVVSKRARVEKMALSSFRKKAQKLKAGVKVSSQSTCIPLPDRLSDLLEFIKQVKRLTPENKLKIRCLILTVYNQHRAAFYIYSLLNLLGNGLFFAKVVFRAASTPFFLSMFYLIYMALLAFELIDLYNKRAIYFQSVYNWLDILLYPTGMALVHFLDQNGYRALQSEPHCAFVVLILYVALTRVVSMLRVLDSTRYMIMIILRVYVKITPFMSILLVYILGTGSIYLLVTSKNPEDRLEGFFWRDSEWPVIGYLTSVWGTMGTPRA